MTQYRIRMIYSIAVLTLLSSPCQSASELEPGETPRRVTLKPKTAIDLGLGWANTTVNTVIFRHHGVVTRGPYQFAAFYDDQSRMVFARRDLRDNSVTSHRIPGEYNTRDAHNSISLGIDPDGYLHASYDHHCHPLRYRRSAKPLEIDAWTEPLPMTEEYEERVTYPYFIMASRDDSDRDSMGDFFFMYRHGGSGNGDICLKIYDSKKQRWSDRAKRFVKGTDQVPWTSNAYWDHPSFDSKGRMHLSWVWRVNKGGPAGGLLNNINVGYARTPDGGETWLTSRGLALPLPITQVNGEVIQAIPPGSNMINQCSSAIDSKDRMHIVSYANDPDGIQQYHHLWFDGRWWRFDLITKRTSSYTLAGGGSLQIPISRPDVVIDRQDRIYIIYRGDLTKDRMVAQRLDPPEYKAPGVEIELWDEDLGHAEPVIDRVRWRRDGILSMFIQKNFQPNHDRPTDVSPEPVRIVDWDLQSSPE